MTQKAFVSTMKADAIARWWKRYAVDRGGCARRATSMSVTGSVGQNVRRAAARPVITASACHCFTAYARTSRRSANSAGAYTPGNSLTTSPAASALCNDRWSASVSDERRMTDSEDSRNLCNLTP